MFLVNGVAMCLLNAMTALTLISKTYMGAGHHLGRQLSCTTEYNVKTLITLTLNFNNEKHLCVHGVNGFFLILKGGVCGKCTTEHVLFLEVFFFLPTC